MMTPDAFEKTLAVIGTDLLPDLPRIERTISDSGLFILRKKRFLLRHHQVEYLSSHILKARHDPDFTEWTTAGPVVVLIIGGTGAVAIWLDLIGQQAHVRGSPSPEVATREIRFFFPETRFEADLGVGARRYLSETVYTKLLEGLVALSRARPTIPVLWLAEWLLENRPHEQ